MFITEQDLEITMGDHHICMKVPLCVCATMHWRIICRHIHMYVRLWAVHHQYASLQSCFFPKDVTALWFAANIRHGFGSMFCMRNTSHCTEKQSMCMYVCVCEPLTETPRFCASSRHEWCDVGTRPSPHLNPRPRGNSPSLCASLRPGNQPGAHRRHVLHVPSINSFLW